MICRSISSPQCLAFRLFRHHYQVTFLTFNDGKYVFGFQNGYRAPSSGVLVSVLQYFKCCLEEISNDFQHLETLNGTKELYLMCLSLSILLEHNISSTWKILHLVRLDLRLQLFLTSYVRLWQRGLKTVFFSMS